MAQVMLTPVKDLKLDLANFRTMRQPDDVHAVQAMVRTRPDRFWALTESLLKTGFHATENIIVLECGDASDLLVKEGNRRIAALKLIFGELSIDQSLIPKNIATKMEEVSEDWKARNSSVPCAIYDPSEEDSVDWLVTLIHGKGDQASRDEWNAVAKARHNREKKSANEPGLDVLEEYLTTGMNLDEEQKERWSGAYPVTVLDEALKRLAPRYGKKNAPDLASAYPNIPDRKCFDDLIKDIGLGLTGFEAVRKTDKLATKFSLPMVATDPETGDGSPESPTGGGSVDTQDSTGTPTAGGGGKPPALASASPAGGAPAASASSSATAQQQKAGRKPPALSIIDPKSVTRTIGQLKPKGSNRDKVVTLRDEAKKLDLRDNPLAFCFLLRSMFEISAKAYCEDHASSGGPSATKADGQDRALADTLRDVTAHLTKNQTEKAMVKALHGAMAELGRKDGFLSVTSLNQLVHSTSFSVTATDISALFSNIYPLLKAMS